VTFFVAVLLNLTITLAVTIQSHFAKPGAVPADLCSLVPADLLARVVPSALQQERRVTTNSPEAISDCITTSHPNLPEPPEDFRTGLLDLRLGRFAGSGRDTSARHAEELFVTEKQSSMDRPAVVGDLAGLGDSAYLVVDVVTTSDGSHLQSAATVTVLFDDMVLDVNYSAQPSTQADVNSAAVEVARALVGRLR
jgi:hypothetical protein